MGSGRDIWGDFTNWNGHLYQGYIEANPDTAFNDQVNLAIVGYFISALGVWPGDPRQREFWTHWLTGSAVPHWTLVGWDQILGDHVSLSYADFIAGYSGTGWISYDAGIMVGYP